MQLSLVPILTLLAAGVSTTTAAPWREHQPKCVATNTTVTITKTATTTITSTVLPSKAASTSASASASASASKSSASSASASTSKAASTSSASASVSTASSSKAASASSSTSKVTTSSSTSKAATSSSTSAAHTSSSSSKAPTSTSTSKVASSTSSSAAATSTAPTTSTDANAQTYLDLHNKFRAHYQANAVTWNHTLSVYAQNTANTCVFKHTGGPYGENLAAGVGGGYNITSGFNSWADEASEYSASNPQYSHFTQVVWKGTTQIGCATSSCSDGTIFSGYNQNSLYMVCEYYPPGNVIGQFAQNVGTYQA